MELDKKNIKKQSTSIVDNRSNSVNPQSFSKECSDIISFETLISSHLEKRRKKVVDYFMNSSKDHAAIVMSTIFRESRNHIRIFAEDLAGPISSNDNYRNELLSFILRDGKLDIILQKKSQEEDSMVHLLLQIKGGKVLNKYSNNININYTSEKCKLGKFENVHFCIGDDSMYRIETDTKKFLAQCSLFDSTIAGVLINKFNNISTNN